VAISWWRWEGMIRKGTEGNGRKVGYERGREGIVPNSMGLVCP